MTRRSTWVPAADADRNNSIMWVVVVLVSFDLIAGGWLLIMWINR